MERQKQPFSDRFYFVVNGACLFTMAGKNLEVEAQDVVVIPKDTEYDFEGSMSLVLFSSPGFDPAFEVVCE